MPEESPSWAVALVLGVFAVVCVPLGPFGIFYATRALRQPSPGQPRGVAVAALVLNLVGLAWPLAYLALRGD